MIRLPTDKARKRRLPTVYALATTALRALGVVAWPLWLAYLGWFVTGLFAIWGLALAVARWQR